MALTIDKTNPNWEGILSDFITQDIDGQRWFADMVSDAFNDYYPPSVYLRQVMGDIDADTQKQIDEAYEDGYGVGYEEGASDNFQEAYDEGYEAGYEAAEEEFRNVEANT